jgi:geranylgeranyl pyrophosphate synthase
MMKNMNTSKEHPIAKGEDLLAQVRRLSEKEGARGWKLAQETMLKQKIRSPQLTEAMNYIMAEYRPDFFKPAIVSLCSQAVGGDAAKTVPFGACFVLLARAIGIHDDVIDRLMTRNKRQTLLGKYGVGIALIVSDVLLFKGFTLVRESFKLGVSKETIAQVLDTVDRVWFEQAEGEAFEIQSQNQINVTVPECIDKLRMRSSELEAVARIGGILGGASRREIDTLGRFGRSAGFMSRLRDEIIDMLEFNVLRHRLRRESLPLPIVYALQDGETRKRIIPLISKKRFTTSELRMISGIVDDAGGLNCVSQIIKEEAENACSYVTKFKNKREELQLLVVSLVIGSEEWKPLL